MVQDVMRRAWLVARIPLDTSNYCLFDVRRRSLHLVFGQIRSIQRPHP
jgi:hypothetical protein